MTGSKNKLRGDRDVSKYFLYIGFACGHANIIRFDNAALEPTLGRKPRPYRSVEEMDAAMIAEWNSVVGPRDIVYHLGDMCLHKDAREAAAWRRQLNGTIRLVLGNHR